MVAVADTMVKPAQAMCEQESVYWFNGPTQQTFLLTKLLVITLKTAAKI